MKTLKPSCRKASIRALRRVRRSTWCQSAPTLHRSPTPASCNRSPAMATTSSSPGRSPKVSTRGRYVWQNITFLHSNTQAVTIGRQQFKDLCIATGISEQVTDVEIFKYIPCRLKVGIEKDKQGVYSDKNRVSRILPLEPKDPTPAKATPKPAPGPTSAAATTAPTAAAKPAAAAGNGPTPPWRKQKPSRRRGDRRRGAVLSTMTTVTTASIGHRLTVAHNQTEPTSATEPNRGSQ